MTVLRPTSVKSPQSQQQELTVEASDDEDTDDEENTLHRTGEGRKEKVSGVVFLPGREIEVCIRRHECSDCKYRR